MEGLTTTVLLGFLIRALLWGLTYYFIRRALNPEVEDLKKFRADAMYGTLASFVSIISYWFVDNIVFKDILRNF